MILCHLVDSCLGRASLERNLDSKDVPSSSFPDFLAFRRLETASVVGLFTDVSNSEAGLGRRFVLGGDFVVIPFLAANSDFTRHNGNFNAEIYGMLGINIQLILYSITFT